MTQQEFFERTKVCLTSEEYANVEEMYYCTDLEKDEFCKQWLKVRDNGIVGQLMQRIGTLNGRKELLEKSVNELTEWQKTFAKKLIKACEYDFPSDIYEVIKAEFGIDFIIKSKWEQSQELSEKEIEYLVNKL